MPTVGVGETDVVYLNLYLHAKPIYLLAEFHSVYIAQHWGIINVPLLCHGHLKKAAEIWA